jgi:putative oxidoreductase
MDKMREFVINAGLLWLRVLMGAGIAYHGYQKLAKGAAAGLAQFATSWGFPAPSFFAWAAVLSEFAGGILLVIGLMTRPAAALILTTMVVAAFLAHGGDPWFAIDVKTPGGASKELALCYGVMAATLLLAGGGKFSLDSLIWPRVFSKKK